MPRKRNQQILLRVTEREKEIICKKSKEAKLSLNDYLIKSSTQKEILVIEGLPEICKEFNAVGNNINQITKSIHLGKSECDFELNKVKDELKKIWLLLKQLVQGQV
ncbi:MAG: plasmid mobilization protein [Eubacteriaceae bacterium]